MSVATLFRRFAKNNERLLGIEMKKFIILLLVVSLLGLTGCGLFGPDEVTEICEIANNSHPTKITTEVSVTTKLGESLSGYYVTTTDGINTKFEYEYETLATLEESAALDGYDSVIPHKGSVLYQDGKFMDGEGDEWRAGTETSFELKFFIDESLLKDVTLAEDGYSFEAKVDAKDLAALIGTDLNAVGTATITVETNGANLTKVSVSCTTKAGNSITVRTSYTYNKQDLSAKAED